MAWIDLRSSEQSSHTDVARCHQAGVPVWL